MGKIYKLWARVGVSVKVTEGDKGLFLSDPQKFIEEGLKNGKATFDGETYFPQGCDCEDNDEVLQGKWD